jgi:hypothetical protein
MAKLKRERAVKEKRALKLEKKAAKKQAAADALNGITPAVEAPADSEERPPDGLRSVNIHGSPRMIKDDLPHDR